MNTTLHRRPRFRAALALLCGWLTALSSAHAAGADDATTVAPFISEPTCAIIRIDTAKATFPTLPDQIASALPDGVKLLHRFIQAANQKLEAIRSPVDNQPIYATVEIPDSRNHDWPAYLIVKNSPQLDAAALVEALGGTERVDSCIRGDSLVAMGRLKAEASTRLDRLVPSPRDGLGAAFDSVAGYPVQVLLLPPDFVHRTMVDLMPTLPAALGGGPSIVLTDGVLWAAVGADFEELRVSLVIQSASEEAAGHLVDHLPKLVEGLYQALPERHRPVSREGLNDLSQLIKTTVENDRVAIQLAGQEAIGDTMQLLAAGLVGFHAHVHQREDMDKVKTIMLALHNFHDAYRMLPPRDGARDKEGRPGLSWRVHILPFINQRALYKQFHLDEPWDSPHNKKLITTIPKPYVSGQIGTPPGHTTILAPVGEDTVFGGTKATRFSQISDGLSNTIALVQVKPEFAVPWTAPDDYAFDAKAPGKGLQIDGKGQFLIGMFDGSANRLRGEMSPETMRRLFRKSDGEAIDWNDAKWNDAKWNDAK